MKHTVQSQGDVRIPMDHWEVTSGLLHYHHHHMITPVQHQWYVNVAQTKEYTNCTLWDSFMQHWNLLSLHKYIAFTAIQCQSSSSLCDPKSHLFFFYCATCGNASKQRWLILKIYSKQIGLVFSQLPIYCWTH